eukprot:219891_1
MSNEADFIGIEVFNLYKKVEIIGSGSMGEVWKCTHIPSGRTVAVKIIDLDCHSRLDKLSCEIRALAMCRNKRIVEYIGSHLVNQELWIILEFLDGGSVFDMARERPVREEIVQYLMRRILQSIHHLHSLGFVHRDIKGANILLEKDGSVKLGDFGLVTEIDESGFCMDQSTIGSPFWIAPEIIIPECKYDAKVDIWSLGITCFELMTGDLPHSDTSMLSLFPAIVDSPPPEPRPFWSNSLKSFVSQCLQKDPKKRPSAHTLLNHKFIKRAPTRSARAALQEKLRARAPTQRQWARERDDLEGKFKNLHVICDLVKQNSVPAPEWIF